VDIKRLDRFIRIINQVSESVPELLAIVIGDGPSREPAEALVLHSKTVRFEGWKRDLGVYFSAADVVCLTSDNEGMPIALIEAALCGVPSVAANVGSTKEVVLDGLTGFVVKADDEAAYVEHLINLFKDPVLRNKLSINAIDHGNNTFGAERLAKDHAIIYQTQLAEMSK
jgi:glycosyltransferase involved in cell wall biosynthesis